MTPLIRLLGNRDFVLMLAVGLGLVAGGGAAHTQPLALPALAGVMTLSLLGVGGPELRSARMLLRASLGGALMSYLVLTGVILLLAYLIPLDPTLRDGFIIIAACPPAVAVIPFTDILDGDRVFSLLGTVGAYLVALAVMPAMALLFWSEGVVSAGDLLVIMLKLVIAPVVLSRVLTRLGWSRRLMPWRGKLTNWCFFLVSYTVVGLNAPAIFADPAALLPVLGLAVVTTVGLGLAIELAGRLRGMPGPRVMSLVLLGTLKNYGLAGGLALALFERRSALPAVVSVAFMFVYVIWLGWLKRRRASAPATAGPGGPMGPTGPA
ncbi:MAG: hypothetical protein V1797_13385 [Pseudomonadota bacterium]